MTVRVATNTPPFVLDEKRAVVKSLDQRGREQFGFGDAREVWINFALVPIAGGMTDSIEMRFVGGAYWYRVEISRQHAFDLLAQEPGTEEIRQMIEARYSLDAIPAPRSRLRCQFITTSRRCDREAEPDWTTCKAHYDQGSPREEEVSYITDEPIAVKIASNMLMDGTIPEEEPPVEVLDEEEAIHELEAEEEAVNAEIAAQRDELLRRVWELEHEVQRLKKDEPKEHEDG